MGCGNLLRCYSPEEDAFVAIADITQQAGACLFLMKLETDVEHLCKMKAAEWENTLKCGVFIVELKEGITRFLSKDLKSCHRREKKIVKDCLLEVRKILRVLQMAYATKVSSLTIHSMVSDMRNYIRETRTALGKLKL
jgi:hypothetical protein